MSGSRQTGVLSLRTLGAGLLLAACGTDEEPPARSALLVTLDTTRQDALGTFGAPAGVTPELDRLAEEAVVYERAYTVAPLTLPAHASMLTGLYPPRHTVRTNGRSALPQAAVTLAERAAEAGLETGAFLSSVVLGSAWGLDQGFGTYDAPAHHSGGHSSFYPERSGAETVARATEWLRARARETDDPRFLLWVHLWEPHAPWFAPEPFEGTTPSPYLDEVRTMDAAIGELLGALRELGLYEETLVVVAADHGEGLGDHGETSHGALAYDTTLRVPLLVRRPGGHGARSGAVVTVADVAPTVLAALGLPAAPDLDGVDLAATPEPERGVYFETYRGFLPYGWSPLAGWVDRDGKLVVGSRSLVGEPGAAPGDEELKEGERAAARAALAGVLARPALEKSERAPLDAGLEAALRSLGYAGAAAPAPDLPSPLEPTTRPSPMDRVEQLGRLERALALVNEGRFAEAEPVYMALLLANPENLEARENLAFCRLRQLRIGEARAEYRALAESGRASPRAITYLGVCLRASGEEEEAERQFARALELDPVEVEALWQMVDLLQHQGREEETAPFRRRLAELEGRTEGQ